MKRLIYLAYPIDNALMTDVQLAEIDRCKHELIGHDQIPAAVVFDPGDAFVVRKGAEPGPEISYINERALDMSHGVLAFLPRGISSVGVPMEIASAALQGKPVAVVSDTYSWSLRQDRTNLRVFAEGEANVAIEWLLSAEVAPTVAELTEPMPYTGLEMYEPTRAYPDDAGLDLYVAERVVLEWGEFKDVPLGINVALPPWSWGFLTARSSTFRKRQIEVLPGIIDAGYRGELFAACVWRPADGRAGMKHVLDAGDRIAQLIVLANATREIQPMRADLLPVHARGVNGFGSSGV